jgi:hypothetical protein
MRNQMPPCSVWLVASQVRKAAAEEKLMIFGTLWER